MANKYEVFKTFTMNLASLSKCEERKVAAIITSSDMSQIYSIGINGGAKRQDDCMCNTEGKYGCVHAEINALIKNRAMDDSKCMFVTLAPCKQCAAAIVNAPGFFRVVYYFEDWKCDSGIKILTRAGISVKKL